MKTRTLLLTISIFAAFAAKAQITLTNSNVLTPASAVENENW